MTRNRSGAPRASAVLLAAVAAVSMAACSANAVAGGPARPAPETPRSTAAPGSAAPSAAGSGPGAEADWVHQFCAGPHDSELYVPKLGPATQYTADQLTVGQLDPTRQALLSTTSALDGAITAAAGQLAGAAPPPQTDAARQRLLGVYRKLD